MLSFQIDKDFVETYNALPEPFGFNGLGLTTFYRTYARRKDDNTLETWVEACERVINGMYSIQRDYCIENKRSWSDHKAQRSAKEAFDRLFNLKWTPPGRGLAQMGGTMVHERGVIECLQNCSFHTTEHIAEQGGAIFQWIMEMLMLGVGVGTDTRGAGKVIVWTPFYKESFNRYFVIEDTRESWAESIGVLVDSYIQPDAYYVQFDYSKIRPAGELIRGFGGTASGPEPLKEMHENVRKVLDANVGKPITSRTITDIANMIGVVVIAGNSRRSAEIILGDITDEPFLNLKNYELNPDRAAHGWTSNNSIITNTGIDYSPIVDRIMDNGEPGIIWLDNTQMYGRMGELDVPDKATGYNPCAEIPLEGYSEAGLGGELCTLADLHLNRHDDIEDFLRSLKFAYLYAKTVTLLSEKARYPGTREIMSRNRRIGLSVTGVAQLVSKSGVGDLVEWLDTGYDYVSHYDMYYSRWLGINESIRKTTTKPSGSVGLLSGSTPGVHYPHSEYYIRRIRLGETSHLVKRLRHAGLYIEPDAYSKSTVVANFPIHAGEGIRRSKDLTIWEQLELASIVQQYWADNSVSVTISINPKKTTKDELRRAIEMYQFRMKSVSFLPEIDGGAYEQMPYEEISKEVYDAMVGQIDYSKLVGLHLLNLDDDKMIDAYCDGIACEIRSNT